MENLRLDWHKPSHNTPGFLILIFLQVVMDRLQQIKVCFRHKKKQLLSYLHHNLLYELLLFVTLSGIILRSYHKLILVGPYVLQNTSGVLTDVNLFWVVLLLWTPLSC